MRWKARKRKMYVVAGILLVLAGAIMVWFHIPYSPVKSDFRKEVLALIADNHLSGAGGIFQKEDFAQCQYRNRKFIYSAVMLQDYITFEKISDYEVEATITYGGQTASGIFTFNEQYEMISFTTKDRAAAGTDGSMEYIPWSALCGDYQISANGIK